MEEMNSLKNVISIKLVLLYNTSESYKQKPVFENMVKC